MVDICKHCGSELLERTTGKHYENILGQKTYVCEVGGYKCLSCGQMHLDEEALKYIEQNIQVKKTERMQDSDYVPILINNIRTVRLNTKLSQKMIGNALGVTEQRYGTIERNANTPTVVTEHQIAEILGVKTDDLYKLVYIPKSFYEDLKDMEIIEKNGEYDFKVIEEVRNKRNELFRIRDEIQKINDERRKIKNNFKKGNISLEDHEEKLKVLDKEKDLLVIKKSGKNKKSGIELEVKKLESKHNLILKQENVIDAEDWSLVKEKYKDRLREWAY